MDEMNCSVVSGARVCPRCCQSKPIDLFNPSATRKSGLSCYCRDCSNEKNRLYRNENKEKTAGYSKKWAENNPSAVKAKQERWAERNPGRMSELTKNWRLQNRDKVKAAEQRHRAKVSVRVHRALASRIRWCVSKESQKTFALLEYSKEELLEHLEKQFAKGMTWENYGWFWHIDHIIPLCSFDVKSVYDPLLKEAWSLSNLRPLTAQENLRKNKKILHLI